MDIFGEAFVYLFAWGWKDTKNILGQDKLFPRTAVTNYHKLGGLKQQIYSFTQYWKPEVHNQGLNRAVLPSKALGDNSLSLPTPFRRKEELVIERKQEGGFWSVGYILFVDLTRGYIAF